MTDEAAVAAWLREADRDADWSAVRATVAGLGRSGFAAADALLRVGAQVEVIDASAGPVLRERAQVLDALGAVVRLEADAEYVVTGDLLIPSPGLPPHHAWIVGARTPVVWSGEQLAWQLRPGGVPWLTVTGTNGKTTTVRIVDALLRAGGHRSTAVGNIGTPLVEAVFADPVPDVLVVELSSFQLHFTPRIAAHSSALLNIADDHLDWHGSRAAYAAAKARIYRGTEHTIVYNHDAPETERMAEEADVVEGCRAVGFTLGVPDRAMLGVVDGMLVDRAFVAERQTHAVEIIAAADLQLPGAHNVLNVLAATALARSYGVAIADIAGALTSVRLDDHRGELVAVVRGVRFVDNSKATNVHAADVALSAEEHVVWIAGGLAKGGRFDDLVRRHRGRLRAVVLLGEDRDLIADALGRHAPEVPVLEVPDGETDPMDHAVQTAAAVAAPHDTVLLAPACASMDQFTDYQARGRAFTGAVARLRR